MADKDLDCVGMILTIFNVIIPRENPSPYNHTRDGKGHTLRVLAGSGISQKLVHDRWTRMGSNKHSEEFFPPEQNDDWEKTKERLRELFPEVEFKTWEELHPHQ